ncbi:MAG: hypothetical protein WBC44_09970 [Planctomycetaceae bacterium]
MKVIGFRADAQTVFWAVVTIGGESPVLEEHGKIRLPKEVDLGDQLHVFRDRLDNIIQRNKPELAALRFQETFLPKLNRKNIPSMLVRARVEGVVTFAAAAAGLPVWTGQSAQMKSGMKTKTPVRTYLEMDEVRGMDWSDLNEKEREAALVAVAAGQDKGDAE